MDGEGGPPVLTKILGNIICYPLGANEDENLRVLLTDLIQVLDEFITLLEVAADFHDLLDVVICGQFKGANVDLNEVFQEILISV